MLSLNIPALLLMSLGPRDSVSRLCHPIYEFSLWPGISTASFPCCPSRLWLGKVVAPSLAWPRALPGAGSAGCAPGLSVQCSVPQHSLQSRWPELEPLPFPWHSPRCDCNSNALPGREPALLTGLLSFVCRSSWLRMTILIMFALCMMKVTFLTDFAGLEV